MCRIIETAICRKLKNIYLSLLLYFERNNCYLGDARLQLDPPCVVLLFEGNNCYLACARLQLDPSCVIDFEEGNCYLVGARLQLDTSCGKVDLIRKPTSRCILAHTIHGARRRTASTWLAPGRTQCVRAESSPHNCVRVYLFLETLR